MRRLGKVALIVIVVWLGLGAAVQVARTLVQDDDDVAAGPNLELCASVRDLLNSLSAASRNASPANMAVADEDYRSLTREANRSPGGFEEPASEARTAWSEFRLANSANSRASEDKLQELYERALTPIFPIENACFPD